MNWKVNCVSGCSGSSGGGGWVPDGGPIGTVQVTNVLTVVILDGGVGGGSGGAVTQSGVWSTRTQDGVGNPVASSTTTPAGTEQALVVRNIPSGTQSVAGTVTANAGTGNFTVTQATGSNLHVVVDTAPTTAVTGPLTDAQLRATSVPVTASQGGTWNLNNVSGTVSLPTGASTETTLGTRLADATFTGRIPTNGQKVMTGSVPVVIASDQSALTIFNGTLDTGNSSTATLGAGAVFTGTSFDAFNQGSVMVYVQSNVASAANGLSLQWSNDGTNWNEQTTQTFTPSVGNAFTVQATERGRFFRVVYTNGGTIQASFRLQTIHKITTPSGDVLESVDPINATNHVQLTRALPGKIATAPLSTAVTCATTATLAPTTVLTSRTSLVLRNNSSATIYIGGSGVTTANGFPLSPGSTFADDVGAVPYYCIVASGTADLRALEN